MEQPFLFDLTPAPSKRPKHLDPESERVLSEYAAKRSEQGMSDASVRRECSQLRSVVHACASPEVSLTLVDVMVDMPLIGQALREPPTPISERTGRARLAAVQSFVRLKAPALGRNAEVELADLIAQLPAKRSGEWHESGVRVAGGAAPS